MSNRVLCNRADGSPATDTAARPAPDGAPSSAPPVASRTPACGHGGIARFRDCRFVSVPDREARKAPVISELAQA
jgi:hypothetical protein